MTLAFEELFGVTEAFRGIPMAGRTDSWILADAAAAHGIPPDAPALSRLSDTYLRHLATEITDDRRSRYAVMPGVRELPAALADPDERFLAPPPGNPAAGARRTRARCVHCR